MTSSDGPPEPRSLLIELVQRDAGYARTLGVASLLGQGMILEFSAELGRSAEAQRDVLTQLMASMPKELPELEEAEALAFIEALGNALERYASLGEREAAALDRALETYERRIAEPAEAAGFGGEVAKVVSAVGLAAALLLGEAKLSGNLPLPGGGYVNLEPGVPAGLQPLLDLVGKAVIQPPAGGSPPGSKAASPNAPPVLSEKPGTLSPRHRTDGAAATSRDRMRRMSYHDALRRRDDVLQMICNGTLLNFLQKAEDAFFVPLRSKGFIDTWNAEIPHNRSFAFSAGVFSVMDSGRTNNSVTYRVGLRVQSLRRLKIRTLEAVARELDSIFPNDVSVRWTSPMVHLASMPHAAPGGWSIGCKDRVALGAPVNVPGGAVGSWTMVFKDRHTGEPRALTAGHTIFDDDGRSQPGDAVFCPPQPLDADQRHRFGSLVALETFPPFNPLASITASNEQGFAVIHLAPGRVPLDDERRHAGTRIHAGALADMHQVREARPRMVKLAARTREATGRFVQSDVRAEIINPITGITVVGDRMIEIEVDHPFAVGPGDSGALVCTDDGEGLRPCAMVVAAVRKALLPSVSSRTRSAIYALPLSHVSATNDLEVW